ncbi:MAG: ABC transporter permease [Chloroflexota bacterium]|nr:ABC transporter permease [Chloroflexota bacterium]
MTGTLTILQLTIRQFLRAKSVLVVAGICAIPVLFAVILRMANPDLSAADKREVIGEGTFLGVFSSTLLPLAALVLSTSALGDELDDKTLHYLALKPVSRLRIAVEKYIGTLLITVPIAWGALLAVWLVVSWGETDATRELLWPMLVASLSGVAGFAALFQLISLYVPRALLVGIFYVFVWEATVSQFLPGIRSISIRHYMQSIFVRLVDDPDITLEGVSRLSTASVTIAVIVVLSLLLSAWRLRRMNLD